MRRTLFSACLLGLCILSACSKRNETTSTAPPVAPPVARPARVKPKTTGDSPGTAAPARTAGTSSTANPEKAWKPIGDRLDDRMPTAPPNSSKTNPINLPMTEAMHRYMEANGKLPQDFQVLVKTRFLPKLPEPPQGKRFAVDRRHLQVVILDQ
ncbi:MAG: hypothetical protein WCS99_12965 [Limisphaerales bacterium]